MKPHKHPLDALIETARKDRDIILITTDLAESTRIAAFGETHPQQFIQCGRSDEHALLLAIGLAHEGKKPVVITYAVNTLRSLEALMLAGQNDSDVKIVATHAGLSSGQEGASTQTLSDVALWRSVPDLTILVPADAHEGCKTIIAALTRKGPTIIRLPRAFTEEITTEKTPFHISKTTLLRSGDDCTLIACGPALSLALKAAERLASQDINCTVLSSSTIKPLDKHSIFSSCTHTGCAVTVEEHSVSGGLGSAVAELLAGQNIPLEMIGTPETFGESGTPAELFGRYGLTVEHLIKAAKDSLVRKCKTPCTNLHEQHAALILPPAPEQHFKIEGGGVIRTIPELASMLPVMDDLVYARHAERKDFSKWVTEVFKQKELGALISRKKNKLAMASAIHRWLR